MKAPLRRLAAARGIAIGYRDAFGAWRAASGDTVRTIVSAMHVDIGDEQSSEWRGARR